MALREEPELARSPGISYQELLDTDTRPVPRRAPARVDRRTSARTTSRSSATRRAAGTTSRSSGSGSGCGSSPAGRRTSPSRVTTTSTRSPTMSFLVVRTEHGRHQGVPERVPAPGPAAEGPRRALQRAPMPVPRLRLAPRRCAEGRAGAMGLPPRRRRRPSICPRRASARGRASSSSTPIPAPRRSRLFVERPRRASSQVGTSGAVLQGGARRPGAPGELEDRAGGVLRGVPRERHAPADPAVPRRHEQPGRHLGQLRSGDHARRDAEPAARLEADARSEMMRAMLDVRDDEELPVTVADGETMRAVAAELSRIGLAAGPRRAGSMPYCDAELMDSIDYTLFPNFHPWGALNRIVYRFRPNGDDHRSSIMDVLLLAPFAGAAPPPAPVHWLAADEPWTNAPELGLLAKVFDQDVVQHGQGPARARRPPPSPASPSPTTRKSKIRWLHRQARRVGPSGGDRGERHPAPVHRRAVRTGRRRHGARSRSTARSGAVHRRGAVDLGRRCARPTRSCAGGSRARG